MSILPASLHLESSNFWHEDAAIDVEKGDKSQLFEKLVFGVKDVPIIP